VDKDPTLSSARMSGQLPQDDAPTTPPASPDDISGIEDLLSSEIQRQIQESIQRAERFILENAGDLAKIMGASGLTIEVGRGWATDLKSGRVTVDPTFFIEAGYDPDWVNYGMMHEVAAHLIELINNPVESKRRWNFAEGDRAKHLFLNILEDIAGNKRMHALLPRQKEVAADVYEKKLFNGDDFTKYPLHIQFMYKMIKQEMVPGCEVAVDPRVDEALDSLRDYEGSGTDIIKISTNRLEDGSNTKEMSRDVQFQMWLTYIYPLFEELRQQAIEEKEDEDGDGDGDGEGGGDGGNGGNSDNESDNQDKTEGKSKDKSDKEKSAKADNFDEFYDDYEQNKHPEPIDHEELEKVMDEAASKKRDEEPEAKRRKRKEKELAESGHGISDEISFRKELISLSPQITEMSEFFSGLLDERAISSRQLRAASPEGAVLNPNTLAQTIVDIKSKIPSPPQAFLDYEKVERERKAEGKFDCYLAIDCSSSMAGQREVEAKRAAIVFLEGLAEFEREIRSREQASGAQLDWDVRSSVSVFGSNSEVIKPLGHELTDKQRLDTFAAVNSGRGGTADFLALEEIHRQIQDELNSDPASVNRRRIVIVVTDAMSENTARLQRVVNELMSLGVSVVGLGIQTPSINAGYPVGESIDDVEKLAETLTRVLEDEIQR
jgi:hypothetical protein